MPEKSPNVKRVWCGGYPSSFFRCQLCYGENGLARCGQKCLPMTKKVKSSNPENSRGRMLIA